MNSINMKNVIEYTQKMSKNTSEQSPNETPEHKRRENEIKKMTWTITANNPIISFCKLLPFTQWRTRIFQCRFDFVSF